MGQADANLEDHKERCERFDNVSIACSGISLFYQPSLEKEEHLIVAVRELGMLQGHVHSLLVGQVYQRSLVFRVPPQLFSSTIHLCCSMCSKDAVKVDSKLTPSLMMVLSNNRWPHVKKTDIKIFLYMLR